MKRKPAPPQYAPKADREVEVKLDLAPCCVCHKPVEGYFGWVSDKSGVCSKTCEEAHKATRPSLIDYIIPKGVPPCGASA